MTPWSYPITYYDTARPGTFVSAIKFPLNFDMSTKVELAKTIHIDSITDKPPIPRQTKESNYYQEGLVEIWPKKK